MQQCGHTACPGDSHHLIQEIADYKLITKGGEGVVREVLEDVVKIDFLEMLYPK